MRIVPLALLGIISLIGSGCLGSAEVQKPPTPTPTVLQPACPELPIPSAIFQIDSPEPGLSYTRHIPIHGWVRPEDDGLVDIEILSSSGGLLAASQLALGEDAVNGFHEIDGTIVLQILPDRERACVSISGRGWTALVPVRVGGGNP